MQEVVELNVAASLPGRGPVTTGIPLPCAILHDPHKLVLRDANNNPVRLQSRTLDRWPDGSVRWALLDWFAEPNASPYHLDIGNPEPAAGPRVQVQEHSGRILVDTGELRIEELPFPGGFAFRRGIPGGGEAGAVLFPFMTGDLGRLFFAFMEPCEAEESGPVRTVIKCTGLMMKNANTPVCRLEMRLHCFAGSAAVRIDFTVRNPWRARHPGGLWDLGDEASLLLKDLYLRFSLPPGTPSGIRCSTELGLATQEYSTPFELYQDSSGGENWQSTNHINRKREVPTSFRGYRLRAGMESAGFTEQTGARATPIVIVSRGEYAVGVAMPEFWQNFPMAVEAENDSLILRLLPKQSKDLHELQGGEQKTWTFTAAFGTEANPESLEWLRTPPRVTASPAWYCNSGAIPYLTPKASDPNADYLNLVDAAIEGPDTFDRKRKVIDEYGWRHFGDIYGDHEAVFHTGPLPLVSHYNNQYDAIAGFAYQFLRGGDLRWLRHCDELARHVIDIDIYHTTKDKAAYNGGLFWHTYHYADADTGTHRSYPRSLLQMKQRAGLDPNDPKVQRANRVYAPGGGPANEHNYTTGLLLHYFLTGNAASREAVLGLAQWVIDMDDGAKTIFRFLTRANTGLASQSRDASYHGPGRGSGNSLSVLLDGHRLSNNPTFLAKAEQLIRRCIHPNDDVPKRNLLDVENRWFYTMFLQALGKYLDHKAELGQLDFMYAYARASLLHYARWMAEHEIPTLARPEILEYPNETWAAQDLRKCEVFQYAAKHAEGAEKSKFTERAEYFFRDSISRLSAFKTRTLARPVVLLLSLGYSRAFFQRHPEEAALPPAMDHHDFGEPEDFVPQKLIARQRAEMICAAGFMCLVLTVVGLAIWLFVSS